MIRISGMKRHLKVDDAKANETKYQTSGKYNGTTYEFKHKVQKEIIMVL